MNYEMAIWDTLKGVTCWIRDCGVCVGKRTYFGAVAATAVGVPQTPRFVGPMKARQKRPNASGMARQAGNQQLICELRQLASCALGRKRVAYR